MARTDVRELPARERLRRFRRESAGASREERRSSLLRHWNPDAPPIRGCVTIGDADGSAEVVPWQHSMTKPGHGSTEIRIHRVMANPDLWADLRTIRKRTPDERIRSLAMRYVAEYKRGNHALLEGLLSEVCSEYWKAGMPVYGSDLERLAVESLKQAEARQRQGDWRKREARKQVAQKDAFMEGVEELERAAHNATPKGERKRMVFG